MYVWDARPCLVKDVELSEVKRVAMCAELFLRMSGGSLWFLGQIIMSVERAKGQGVAWTVESQKRTRLCNVRMEGVKHDIRCTTYDLAIVNITLKGSK